MDGTMAKQKIIVLLLVAATLSGYSCFFGNIIDDDTVRQPTGNVEAFWNQFTWDELTTAEQSLWMILGWDEARWSGVASAPASEMKLWSQLSESERNAASDLGYSQQSWDMS